MGYRLIRCSLIGPETWITPADIKAWNLIRQSVLSNDGKWFAYVVSPTEANATLIVRGTAQGASEARIPVGENGGSAVFSGDSRWLGYIVAPPRVDSAARARGAGRGGAGNARGGGAGPGTTTQAADTTRRPTANKFVLMNLASGEKTEFDRIRRFQFNGDTYIVESQHNGATTPSFTNGTDIAVKLSGLVDLSTATLLQNGANPEIILR